MEPGKFYRRTRGESDGGYFVRPKSPTASAYIAKLRRKSNPWTREVWLIQQFKADPSKVLVKRYSRGTDFITGQKWEFSSYTLLPADLMLREVKTRPGYK
tara:strand:+ start:3624 stop:3923 length:300 start_codon:yes stop_codon:yes gene_type:complete